MVVPPPCTFSGEQNEQTVEITSNLQVTRLLSAGVTSELNAITNCPHANNQ